MGGGRSRSLIAGSLAVVAVGLSGLIPASAGAAVTCSRSGTVFTVFLSAAGDEANLGLSGANIQVRDKTFATVACTGAPTTANVDTVNVTDTSTGSTAASVNDVGSFAPGATAGGGDAGAATDEIEFNVSLGSGSADSLDLTASNAGDAVRWGTSGINPNATQTENTPDTDITLNGVERNSASGTFGSQNLSGNGAAGTGGPFTGPLELDGGFDQDILVGGSGNDKLDGSFGDDILSGAAGDDQLDGSFGADQLLGLAGVDTAVYRVVCNPEDDCGVKVTLAADGAVDGNSVNDDSEVTPGKHDSVGSDIENVTGTPDDDTLTGGPGPNVLDGGLGRDRLSGAGGVDLLVAQDFVQDLSLNCGAGKPDRVERDRFDPRGKGCERPRHKHKKHKHRSR